MTGAMEKIVVALVPLLLTGCPTPAVKLDPFAEGTVGALPHFPVVSGFAIKSSNENTAKANEAAMEAYAEEAKLYPSNSGREQPSPSPRYGLALSGGGIRAAFFCIGVMKGLEEIHLLENIDAISSVSGGGYASSWYYTQRVHDIHLKDDQLLIEDPNYNDYLVNHGELLSHFSASTNAPRWLEYTVNFIETGASLPVDWTLNGVFGLHENVAPIRRIYEDGIDRSFHVVPGTNGRQSTYDFIGAVNLSFGLNPPVELSFDNLRSALKERKLPVPIVNTTAHIEDPSDYDSNKLGNRVFEFTPLGYGSDYFGHWTYAKGEPFNFNRAVAVSGAAADSTNTFNFPSEQFLTSIANWDLAYYIDNPNPDTGFWAKLVGDMPLLVYFGSDRFFRTNQGAKIYLADGGDSENLGAYSIVRRLCPRIIIVDAEHDDPGHPFTAYSILKSALRAEMGVDFSIGPIDCFLSGYRTDPKTPFPEDRAVMCGTIQYFPIRKGGTYEDEQIKVIYIKLTAAKLTVGEKDYLAYGYPPSLREFYDEAGRKRGFPQLSTADQTYPPAYVRAFEELGYFDITRNGDRIKAFLAGGEITQEQLKETSSANGALGGWITP